MKEHVVISVRITIALLILTCGVYPVAVWAVGQLAFSHRANGSLIERNGKVIGSEIIGQSFTADRYFYPRPSAAGKEGYDPTASGGTNLGPTSKKLHDAIADAIHVWRQPPSVSVAGEAPAATQIPADAVTSSASGLDPHISVANAYAQAARVARANQKKVSDIRSLIDRHIEGRFLGVYGEPRVNVLALNLELQK